MGSNWKPLPDDISPSARSLVDELRAIRDRSGLSLSQLSARTHYSKSSWERWLNGKRPITPQALASLSACADFDVAKLETLLAQASVEWTDSTAEPASAPTGLSQSSPAAPAAAGADPDAAAASALSPARRLRPVLSMGAIAAILVGGGAAWLSGGPGSGTKAAGSASSSAASPLHSSSPTPAPPCQGIGCAGKDPQSTGCVTDSHVLTTSNVGRVVIYIHYSPRCQAAWGGLTDGAKGDTATITTGTGDQQTALIHWGYDNYSMMVDASGPKATLQVCGKQPLGSGCSQMITNPAAQPAPSPTPTPTPTPTSTPTH
jgi:transcriptional regulator with XRE-family HTH domain